MRAPELVDGRQDQRRQRHHDEQGPRDHRGPPPVRRARGARSRSWSTRNRSCTAWSPSPTARCWPSSASPTCASRSPARWAGRRGSRRRRRGSTCAPVRRLDFEPPDPSASRRCGWPAHALRQGGAAPTVLNAANEVAVAAFLDGRIGFLDIAAHRGARCSSALAAASLAMIWRRCGPRRAGATCAAEPRHRRPPGRRAIAEGRSQIMLGSRHSLQYVSRSCSSCRSSCSCTSSATTGSRGATACGSRCSRSASGPSCSAATTATARAGSSAPSRSGGYVKMLGDADAASATVDRQRTPREPDSFPAKSGLAAHGDRGRGPDGQLPVRDRGAGASCSPPSAGRSRRPRSAASSPDSPAAAAGLLPGDRIIGGRRRADRELRGAAGDRARQRRAAAPFAVAARRRDRSTSRSPRLDERDRPTASATCTRSG